MEAHPHFRLIRLSAPLNPLQDTSIPQGRYLRPHFRVITRTELAVAKPEVGLCEIPAHFRIPSHEMAEGEWLS